MARLRILFSLFTLFCLVASEGVAQQAPVDPALFQGLEFRHVGPSRGGRVTAVAGHRAEPHTFYMGATGGGLWKTDDDGDSWHNVSDGYFETGSIGSISVAPNDPKTIYVGTGSDGIRSNVIIGRGVYKSTDGGKTWAHAGLRDAGQVTSVVIHPENPGVVYAAALGSPFGPGPRRGVFKTTDGGATWDHVLAVSDSTGAVDLELNPADPDEVYAAFWRVERKPWTIISGASAEDGIYKSTDGGATWRKVEAGLPQGLIGKIDLSTTPADPNRVYALVEAIPEEEGLYVSDDRGETWRLVNTAPSLMSRPFYYTNVHADPSDADVVYVNNLAFWKSTDGGAKFSRISTPHGDNHDLWINPDDPEVMIQSNDGGANVTRDGGRTWSTQHNQPTAELYQVDVDDRFPYWLYAGQQDNSTIAVPSLPPSYDAAAGPEGYWEAVGGCETGPVVPRPGGAEIVYANCKGRFGRYSRLTGQEQQYYVGGVNMYGRNPAELPYRFQRVVPIEVSPHNPDVVYHGSQYVHRTNDGGRTWTQISPDLTAFRPERQVASGTPITRDITGEEHYSTLYVIEESPLTPGLLWTGSNDGPVQVSRDGGESWTDVTPPMPPEGRIQSIEPSPHQPGKAYVAAYRYLLDDFAPYLFKTEDYGKTWTRIIDGIPADHPVRVVREDPEREGLLYAGTEFGFFVSFDDGARWQPFQQDLPVTPITDIALHEGDLVVSTMGRGFWIMDDVAPLHGLSEAQASAAPHLFAPNDAVRMRYNTGGGPAAPEYRPVGAVIDYYLAEAPKGTVTLEVLSPEGDVIRTYTSEAEGETEETTQGMRAPQRSRRGTPALGRTAGHHRFLWDLRHEGFTAPNGETAGYGPMAVPGAYQVRLTAGGHTATQPLTVRIDPRVEADGVTMADLRAQLEHNLQVRDAITAARQAAADVDSLQARVDDDALARELQALEGRLVTEEGDSYPPPMLIDQLGYLYGMTARADQAPGADAYARLEDLRVELEAIYEELARLQQRAGAED